METHISPPLLITNFYSRKRERDFSLDFRGRKKKKKNKDRQVSSELPKREKKMDKHRPNVANIRFLSP